MIIHRQPSVMFLGGTPAATSLAAEGDAGISAGHRRLPDNVSVSRSTVSDRRHTGDSHGRRCLWKDRMGPMFLLDSTKTGLIQNE
jgi:hypothetical protein